MLIVFVFSLLLCFGCSKKSTEPDPEPLELQLNPTHVSVFGGSDGAINLTVTGGTKPYQYQWSNGETTEDITNLFAGTYSVVVTDAEAQTKTDSTTILQPNETGTVTDVDGNVYKTVKIGNQWWMAENLKTTRYSDGTPIENFVYENDTSNIEIYGRLYRWAAAVRNAPSSNSNPSGIQGVSPQGWHIPSDAEWQELINYLGEESTAGGKLKEAGFDHWLEPNTGATNETGFNAIPGGWFDVTGNNFWGMGQRCFFLTSTAAPGNDPVYIRHLRYNNASIPIGDLHPDDASSVRCVKD
jgi:uncharacterized protein (TIGR02145 family)